MSNWVRATAQGKINLFFSVGSVMPDGYHDVVSLYQAIELQERVSIRITDEQVGMLFEVGGTLSIAQLDSVPKTNSNLVVKAANKILSMAGLDDQSFDFEIVKQVPVAGGLAGGSADAAAALLATNELLATRFSQNRLSEAAAALGADIPFALLGGTAIGTGRGEQLVKVEGAATLHLVVILNDGGLSTPDVYRTLDRQREDSALQTPVANIDALVSALVNGDLENVVANIHNDLQSAALELMPELELTIAAAERDGALKAFVSGSGPTVIAVARDAQHAIELAGKLQNANFNCVVTKTSTSGATLIVEV